MPEVDILHSQFLATVTGAFIALLGAYLMQWHEHHKSVAEKKRAVIEDLLIAIQEFQAAERKRYELFQRYVSQRLIATYMKYYDKEDEFFGSFEFHFEEAQRALAASNDTVDELTKLRSNVFRWSFRAGLLFPRANRQIRKLVAEAVNTLEWPSDIPKSFRTAADLSKLLAEQKKELAAYKKRVHASLLECQIFLSKLVNHR